MKPTIVCDWQLTPAEAARLQKQLAPQIRSTEMETDIRLIAGVDVRSPLFRKGEGTAAVVILEYPGLHLVESKTVSGQIEFPYVPGLLSFRELPLVLQAFEQLENTPDLIIVDGQGIAHPRRFGIAAHLGLLLDTPTIGCAKSRLCGTHEEPGRKRGNYAELLDDDGKVIGAALRTKDNTKPVYVSVGHKITLEQCLQWVLNCCHGFRLPEPTRLAHQAANGTLKPHNDALFTLGNTKF